MSTWKKLNQQDVSISTYNAQKEWSVSGIGMVSAGITGSLFTSGGNLDNLSTENLTWHSLNQLYYSLFDESGSISTSSSFDNFLESSFITGSRILSDSGIVYSIPRSKFGTHIEPTSLVLGDSDIYMENQSDYVEAPMYVLENYAVTDNGEGSVIAGEADQNITPGKKLGDIIYTHGMIIINDPEKAYYLNQNPDQPLAWKSNLPIYTYNYNIKVSDYEFNFTQNPTAQTGNTVYEYSGSYYNQSSGILADNVTGSYFQPYITAVGLYNDTNELIAVAKLAQPLPKPANTELTIQIKLDI